MVNLKNKKKIIFSFFFSIKQTCVCVPLFHHFYQTRMMDTNFFHPQLYLEIE